jgi:LysR family transcriptional regulator of gallate degradation
MTDKTGFERASTLSFRQLRLFEAIGALESVRRAAEECSLSQPAVTQALAKLETQVGATLVDRRASGSYLNDYGTVFHARVTRFFGQIEQAILETGGAATASSARAIVNRLTRSQIRTLIATIEHGSFDRASEALDVSSASLQRAARDLEGNLHVSLFYRTAAGMLVSPLGTRFGRAMKLALQEIEWGIEELDAARGGISRQIVIGAMPFGGGVLVASVLDTFLRKHENATEMAKRLRGGDVDLVIGLLPELESPELVSEAIAQTPYSVVARRDHPLTKMGRVSTEDVVGYDWVIGTTGSSRRACFERLFAGRKGPQASIVTCALPVIRHLLECSDRLTLMTSYELQHENDHLRAVHVGPILPVPSIGITTRAGWLPTRLHADFLDIIRAHVVAPQVRELRRLAG